jgi:hypothetical protein
MAITLNGSAGVTTTSGAVYDGIQSATAVTASGTSVDFTGIPSWVKRITVMLNGVSTNSTSNLFIQIGSGSIATTGYVAAALQAGASYATSTSGIPLTGTNSAASFYYGTIVLTNINLNTWTSIGTLWNSLGVLNWSSAGTPNLSGALDQIRVTTVNGTDTFDAGSINILYE